MTMASPAIDCGGGSGAVRYLRAETADRRALYLVLQGWTPYVKDSSSLTVPRIITITVPDADFEARSNLTTLIAVIRARAAAPTAADLGAASRALDRLNAVEKEQVESWADRLSTDLSFHRD